MDCTKLKSSKASILLPVFITFSLVIWTFLVFPYSSYGDMWAVIPTAVMAFIILLWHLLLVVLNKGVSKRLMFALYGLVHSAIYTFIWFYCVMKISKSAL